jgi:hypothetical protein
MDLGPRLELEHDLVRLRRRFQPDHGDVPGRLAIVDTFTVNAADQMTNVASVKGGSTTLFSSYGYNGDGLRMCKYAGSSTQPCQQRGATQFLWDVAGSLPVLIEDGTTNYIYGPASLPLEQVSGSTSYWYHNDQIGSTKLITNSSGTLRNRPPSDVVTAKLTAILLAVGNRQRMSADSDW